MKVAKQYEGKYTFCISAKDDFQHELNEFGYDYVPSEKPIIAVKGIEKQKYVMKEEFSWVIHISQRRRRSSVK